MVKKFDVFLEVILLIDLVICKFVMDNLICKMFEVELCFKVEGEIVVSIVICVLFYRKL